MKVALKKASFVGSRDNLAEVIELLKSTNSFQMTQYVKGEYHEEIINQDKLDTLTAIKRRIHHVINFVRLSETKTDYAYEDLKSFANLSHNAMKIIIATEEIEKQITKIQEQIKRNESDILGLREYTALPIAFSNLGDTKSTVNFCGIMPKKRFSQFVIDFDLSKMSLEYFPSGKHNLCVILSAHREDAAIAEVIHTYDFVPCKFSFEKDAISMTTVLHEENFELKQKIEELFKEIKLDIDNERILKNYYDFICNEVDTINLVASSLQTQNYYVLNGWVEDSKIELVKRILKKSGLDVSCEFTHATKDDNMPVLIKSHKMVKPFQNITNMYGLPSGRDIDPNPWVALFYFIFFGMMVGDVGYAIVLACAVACFVYFKKPSDNTKQFVLLFGICSISSLVWGLMFGSVFGFTIGTQVIDPLANAIYVLLIALLCGLLQIAVGLTLNVYVMVKNGEATKAIIKGVPRVVLFAGLILFLPSVALDLFNLNSVAFFDVIRSAGMWITIVGAASTCLTNPYSIISYFNDVISYVRLFALALVGTVIASIGNTMGEMLFGIPILGYILGFVVAVAFHVFNLGLGLLSAYIHGARLQFIEFFSKFYDGDGSKFQPIGSSLKYTNIIKGGN